MWFDEAIAAARPEPRAEPFAAGHPLFLLYTSGSTGKCDPEVVSVLAKQLAGATDGADNDPAGWPSLSDGLQQPSVPQT